MDIDKHILGLADDHMAERTREPKGPFNIEVKFCCSVELWNAREILDYQDAVSEAQVLEDHGFTDWNIIGGDGQIYHPNLKARRVA